LESRSEASGATERAVSARLAGKRAFITGGSSGIGRAIAVRLASEGAFVVVHYGSNADGADATVADIVTAGGHALALRCDLRDVNAIEKMFVDLDVALRKAGERPGLDILINNAGMYIANRISAVTEAEFDLLFDTNFKGLFFVTKHAIDRIEDGGRVINVSSIAARRARPRYIAYGAAKGAIQSFTRSLAAELGPRGITVNAVAPGTTMTTPVSAMFAADESLERKAIEAITLQRIGTPQDIADIVAFLASDDGRWITGQLIATDGGTNL
jgi:3-oxoacyl-[acyl-carrier protein] reductase